MQANALKAGLYTIIMWMFGKCTGERLRSVLTGFHDGKLDYRNLGTFALVQINTEDNRGVETAPKSQERRCHDGSIDRYRSIY
jgi:hypothetical protein